ncbi:MAG: hydrogenase nickel incorporation protein HypB [Bacteroidota bacterium]
MCDTCGCEQPDNPITYKIPGEKNQHLHMHQPEYKHEYQHNTHLHSQSRVIRIGEDVLNANNLLALKNRRDFEAKNIVTINMVSSPGSGKTTLLEKTIQSLKTSLSLCVIEGDQQSMNDASRIQAAGVPVLQINTGNGCHLDADMINKAYRKLGIPDNSILFIENVGNLVCPSLFDLGETYRIVVISVTEGDDKPLKYPNMFHTSDICIINKIDLLPYVDFDVEKTKEFALRVNHHLQFFELSAKSGEGMDKWFEWLKKQNKKAET